MKNSLKIVIAQKIFGAKTVVSFETQFFVMIGDFINFVMGQK